MRQFFPETWLFQLSEVGSPAQLDRLANQRYTVHCKYTVLYNAQHQNCWNNVQCSIFIAVFEALENDIYDLRALAVSFRMPDLGYFSLYKFSLM